MTDQNTAERTLEELKTDFKEARSERTEAGKKFQAAVEKHREIKRISDHLREKKVRLEREQADAGATKRDLDNRISEAKSRMPGIIEEQEQLRAEAEVRELENKLEQSQADIEKRAARLVKLDEKIKETMEEVRKAEELESNLRIVLNKKQENVLAAASEVIKKAASQPLKEKIEGIGARIFDKLGLPGILSVGYIFVVIIGLGGDFIYYGSNGVNIFHYAQPEDFFLSGYKLFIIPVAGFIVLWLVLTGIKKILGVLAARGFPFFTEWAARIIPGAISLFAAPMALAVTIVIMLPVASFASAFTQQWQPSATDEVSIVLEAPLEYADKLNWIGSNSRYAFFRQSKPETGVMIIPLDRIACISDGETSSGSTCRNAGGGMEIGIDRNAAIKSMFDRLIETLESNNRVPQVTESRLYSYIQDTMCRLEISDFILFENARSDLRKPAADDEVDHFLKKNINSSKIVVFGFASPDGHRGENMELARERACKVANLVCETTNSQRDNFEYPAKTTDECGCPEVEIIPDIGEDHFINGVAHSRSAVIAACGKPPSGQV